MADAESTAATPLRPFQRSGDLGYALVSAEERPLVLLDAQAETQPLAALAQARLELLEQWLRLLATSKQDMVWQPDEIAAMLLPMAEDALEIVRALQDRLTDEHRARSGLAAPAH